jgi:CRISPR-associated protein Cmr4
LPGANDVTYDYWREKLRRSLVILPEEAFRDFCRYSTEVNTRVRLVPDSKTVQPGALWTEECLPVDVLMYAPVFATPLRAPETPALWKDLDAKAQASQVLKWMSKAENVPERIQIGGDETVGRGIVRLRWEGGLT